MVKDSQVTLLTKELSGPNGIAFSPDEKYLYVDNWDLKRKVLMRYDVNPDGTIANGKVFYDFTKRPGAGRARRDQSGRAGKRVRLRTGRRLDHFAVGQGARTHRSARARCQFYLR